MQPLVSVLMPCFNAQAFVGAAIASVIGQSWPHIECIVVDDGSTDDSAAVARAVQSQKVTVIRTKNAGASAARNAALRASAGQYVLFMDADDLIGMRHVENLLQAAAGRADTVAMSDWARFATVPEEATFAEPAVAWERAGADWLVDSWLAGAFMTQPGMFLLPRGVLAERGGWDETLSLNDDFEFFTRMLAGTRLAYAPGARLFYRSGLTGSLSGRVSANAVRSHAASLLAGTGHLLRVRDDKLARRASANALMFFVYTYYPRHRRLTAEMLAQIARLGGADLEPMGTPRFHRLRRVIGWKSARLVHLAAQAAGLRPRSVRL